MHPPIYGHSFNRKRARARRNEEDADAGPAGSSASPLETDSGASSSSTAPTEDHYEVFLNFRGLDTRNGFTSHLYDRLVAAGIDVFLDDYKLRQGEEIGPDLLEAIKNSKILIPILSENYCSSKWCLDELIQIMECKNNKTGHIVLPIFYKVKPTDVRHQSGSFGGAFRRRKRPFNPATLEKYKQALTAVSNLKGWEADSDRNEAELVRLIVQTVSNELKKDYDLLISENLVGIDNPVEKVMIDIANNSNVTLFIGIYGMGGIGKTTLANIIFNKLSHQFNSRSFIPDIRESCNLKGLESLQKKLIFDILGEENQVHNKREGTMLLSSKFKKKKVLILLDDVDHYDQLKDLAGNHNWFDLGSRILITSRDRSILESARVDCYHKLEELDKNQSLILFCRHAFGTNSPPSEFKDLAREVVSTTGGLPLSLEVIGSLLLKKEPKRWSSTIKKLREVPHKDVKERLKISYDALEYREQQIFLDVACFLIGTDGRIASYMWDACGFYPEEGIAKLSSMSLIKFGHNHELKMHDQLRDLGREIVREEKWEEPQYHSRLWESEKILKVLKENKGTEKIKAIYFNKAHHSQPFENFEAEQFKKLTGLRFLDVSGACLRGDFENSMGELKWLRWQDCPSTFEANNFHLTELVVLDLSWSKISDEWQGWSSMMAEKLKFLDLTGCQSLRSTVFLSAFKNLEVLILCVCGELEQIDSSIGDMKNLVCLKLMCPRLNVLPDSIGALQNLEILHIRTLGMLELTDGIFRMRKLQDLKASKVTFREIMDISQLNQLRTLYLEDCYNMHPVRGLDKLIYLESLIIAMCNSIERLDLPKSENLKTVGVKGCKNIVEIQSLNRLEFLEELKINDCPSIERLDLAKFEGLKILDIYCENLVEIQGLDRLKFLENLRMESKIKKLDLPKGLKILCSRNLYSLCEIEGLDTLEFLEKLDLSGDNSIERLDLSKSNGLRTLDLQWCENLVEIQGLNKLKFLGEIIIDECNAIEQLDLSNSKGLKCSRKIKISGCNAIKRLDLSEYLESLIITKCNSIKRLDLPKSENLKTVYVEDCKNIVEIQSLNQLKFLEELKIMDCNSIERLHLAKFEGLKILVIDCENLVEIQGLDRLKFLENLCMQSKIKKLDFPKGLKILRLYLLCEIEGLDRLEFLEKLSLHGDNSIERVDLSKSNGLRTLDLQWCENLVEIQGLNKMKFLREIIIYSCNAIEQLDLSNSKDLKCLRKIEIWGCHAIKRLDHSESEGLKFLTEIKISFCSAIEQLDCSKCEGLKILYVCQCENLVEIQGLDKLEFLEDLKISACTSLVRLPNLCCFGTLRNLEIVNCDKLHDIQNLKRLTSCETLLIRDCKFLAKLPNLSNFHKLWYLSLLNCDELREIPGFEKLTSLQVIIILGCSSIEILPDFSSCTNLEFLIVQNCVKLTELQGLEKLQQLVQLDISGCQSLKTIPELFRGRLYQNYELEREATKSGARDWSDRKIKFRLARQFQQERNRFLMTTWNAF